MRRILLIAIVILVVAAAGAAVYHLERFYLPGWSAEKSEQTTRVLQANDGQRGAVLFTRVLTDVVMAREQWPIYAVVVVLVFDRATAVLV